jgi:hypothetical protein
MTERSIEMTTKQRKEEARTGLDHGQLVIVAARWVLIVAGLFLLIVEPAGAVAELRLQIALILLLAIANFFLQAQLLRRRPIPDAVAYAASASDLAVITILVLSQGADSQLYVLYFPALLALSVAFEPVVTAIYAAATALVYGAIAVATAPGVPDAVPVVATRVLMLGAVAFCGCVYWHVERDRRERAERPSAAEGSLS